MLIDILYLPPHNSDYRLTAGIYDYHKFQPVGSHDAEKS